MRPGDSPFRTGPITTLADLDNITSAWVHWYNTSRLMHRLGRRPPAEAEADYYAHIRSLVGWLWCRHVGIRARYERLRSVPDFLEPVPDPVVKAGKPRPNCRKAFIERERQVNDVIAGCRRPRLNRTVESLWNAGRQYRRAYTQLFPSAAFELSVMEHRLIAEALIRGAAEDAVILTQMHTRRTRDALTERTDWLPSGRPRTAP